MAVSSVLAFIQWRYPIQGLGSHGGAEEKKLARQYAVYFRTRGPRIWQVASLPARPRGPGPLVRLGRGRECK